jgi:hypothetical protein
MDAVFATLASPVILFFILGMLAAFARSDLNIPEAIAKGLSIYLMIAIGLKGGVAVSKSGFTPDLILAAAAGLALSFAIPFFAFQLLTRFARLSRVNAAAVSAHYGSVSVVTFVTAVEILARQALRPAGYMVAVLVASWNAPPIITGLLLACAGRRRAQGHRDARARPAASVLHEVLLNASVVLLIAAFLIGHIAGPEVPPIEPLFEGNVPRILCIFLLDMGLSPDAACGDALTSPGRAASLAILMPMVNWHDRNCDRNADTS